MELDQRIVDRLDELILLGNRVLETKWPPPDEVLAIDCGVNARLAAQWCTSCRSILRRTFGEDSSHLRDFNTFVSQISYTPIECAMGVLLAAKDDYQNGHVFELRRLVEAEVYDDLLEQAEYLFSAGYHAPAAVVCGCALEDSLRRLCTAKGITMTSKPKLDQMNADLAKAGVYNKLITALADLRNSAAHGKWGEFSKEDVVLMVRDTRAFLETYFR